MNYALWHPFADMGHVEHQRFEIVRGEGPWVWDSSGRRFLDATSSLWCANLGHGRPEIADAVAAQLRTLDGFGIFGDYANRPSDELAQRLSDLAPVPDSRVFLGAGGGDMIEAAAKIARAYFAHTGRPSKQHLIGRTGGYHGTHGLGTSIGGIPLNKEGFGHLVDQVSQVAYDDADALRAEIEVRGADTVAAFFCEPVIGAGGVLLPSPGYLEEAAQICRDNDVLFVADCVIVAFGRLGTWFGIDRWPMSPDMIVTAKGLTNGTQPVGALVVAPRVTEPFFTGRPGAPIVRHGQTYSGHPVGCTAALAALDVYEKDDLVAQGRHLEGPLESALSGLRSHAQIKEVRAGLGFLAGVELDADLVARHPDAAVQWQLACREFGVLVRSLGASIAVSPPLVCDGQQVEAIGQAVVESLDLLLTRLGEK